MAKKKKSLYQRFVENVAKKLGIKPKSVQKRVQRAAKKAAETGEKPKKIEGVSDYANQQFRKVVKNKTEEIKKSEDKPPEKKEEKPPVKKPPEKIQEQDFLGGRGLYRKGAKMRVEVNGIFQISRNQEDRKIQLYLFPDEVEAIVNADNLQDAVDVWFNSRDNDFIDAVILARSIKINGSW